MRKVAEGVGHDSFQVQLEGGEGAAGLFNLGTHLAAFGGDESAADADESNTQLTDDLQAGHGPGQHGVKPFSKCLLMGQFLGSSLQSGDIC